MSIPASPPRPDSVTEAADAPIISPPVQAWPHRGYAWYVVVALMVAYAFSIIDRTGLGLLVQPIEADLHISDSMMGLLQGVAFAIFYGVLGLPLGLLADRLNRSRLVSVGITVWSAATMACGLAVGFPALFLARLGVGAGEATLSPAGASMIADLFPPLERSKAYGVFAIGTSIGSGMAFLLGGAAIGLAAHLRLVGPAWFAHLATWKIFFLLIGAPGVLIGLLFALTVREPVRRDGGARGPLSLAPLAVQLMRERLIYGALIAGAVLNAASIYALLGWFPTLLIRTHGLSAVQAGEWLGVFGLPCGVLSCLASGWIAAWLERRGRADAAALVAFGGTAWFTIAGVGAALVPGAIPAVVGYCLLALSTNCCIVSILTALNRITPNPLRGQVTALYTLLVGLISLTLGPLSVGLLSDYVFRDARAVGPSLAAVITVCGLLGLAALALARPGYQRLAERTAHEG